MTRCQYHHKGPTRILREDADAVHKRKSLQAYSEKLRQQWFYKVAAFGLVDSKDVLYEFRKQREIEPCLLHSPAFLQSGSQREHPNDIFVFPKRNVWQKTRSVFISRAQRVLNDIQRTPQPQAYHQKEQPPPEKPPIVIDSGASINITSCLDDCQQTLAASDIDKLGSLTEAGVQVREMGQVRWPVYDMFGRIKMIETKAYYVPEGNVRLFSPQTYFQEHDTKGKGRCILEAHRTTIEFPDGAKLATPSTRLELTSYVGSSKRSSH